MFLIEDAELPSGERAKLLDFGIAKLASAGITSTSVSSMGTPLYMSPEQWRSAAKVDGRTDAYSLGCVLFEMACGRPPFLADSMGEACAKHLTEAPPAPSSVVPGLPPAFDALVGRLLEKEAAGRPGMKEVMAALDAIAQALPAGAADRSGARLPAGPVPLTAATISTLPGVAATSVGRTGMAAGGPPPTLPPHASSQPAMPYPQAQAQTAAHAATQAAAQGPAHGAAQGPAHAGSPHPVYPPHAAAPMGQTTLGGAAGTPSGTEPRRGRRIVGWIAGGALVAGAAAAVIAVNAGGGGGGEGSGSQVAAISPAPDAAAPDAVSPPPLDAGLPDGGPPDAPDEAPVPRGDAVLVEASAMKRVAGDMPKGLHAQVSAYFCVDEKGEVTSIEVSVNLARKLADEVIATLERWRYAPYVRDGAALAACFPTQIGPRPATAPPKPPGAGAGSGSGKPPGAGAGSGKPPGPGPGSGSGKPPGPGPGSGSGKPPDPGPGSGSGKPPDPPGPPEQITLAEFQAAMKKLEAQIRRCRAKFPFRGPLRARVVVAPRGHVQSVAVLDAPGPGPTGCVRRPVNAARFPATQRGGMFDVSFPE